MNTCVTKIIISLPLSFSFSVALTGSWMPPSEERIELNEEIFRDEWMNERLGSGFGHLINDGSGVNRWLRFDDLRMMTTTTNVAIPCVCVWFTRGEIMPHQIIVIWQIRTIIIQMYVCMYNICCILEHTKASTCLTLIIAIEICIYNIQQMWKKRNNVYCCNNTTRRTNASSVFAIHQMVFMSAWFARFNTIETKIYWHNK